MRKFKCFSLKVVNLQKIIQGHSTVSIECPVAYKFIPFWAEQWLN